MEIGTAVFRRIIMETKHRFTEAAVTAVADTMEETVRFGCFRRPYIEGCARVRYNEVLFGRSSGSKGP